MLYLWYTGTPWHASGLRCFLHFWGFGIRKPTKKHVLRIGSTRQSRGCDSWRSGACCPSRWDRSTGAREFGRPARCSECCKFSWSWKQIFLHWFISFQRHGKMPWNPSKSWKPGTTFQVCRWLTDYMVGYYRLLDRLSVWILFRQSGKSGSEVLQSILVFLGFTGMVLGCGVACGKMEILGHVTFSWTQARL